MMAMRQLYFGQLDMELHARYDPSSGESIFDVQKRVADVYTPHMPPMEGDRFLCAFNHIFGGGYAAGYYSYKWAEILSADAFGAFEEVGLDNEEAVRAVGRKFRKTVLGYGGGKPPSAVFEEVRVCDKCVVPLQCSNVTKIHLRPLLRSLQFRGREANSEALLRHCGLA